MAELKIPYLPAPQSNSTSSSLPALTIIAQVDTDTVSVLKVGNHIDAKEGKDALDQVAPPGALENMSFHLLQHNAPEEKRDSKLIEAFLPADQAGYRYDITLQAPEGKPVILQTSGHKHFENHQEIVLFDKKLAKRYDLRSNPSITFWPTSNTQSFVLLIGEDAYINTVQSELIPE